MYKKFFVLLLVLSFLFLSLPKNAFAETITVPALSITHTGGTGCNNNANGLVIDGTTCTTSANNANSFLFYFFTDADYADLWADYEVADLTEVSLKWKINTTSSTGTMNSALRLTYNDNNSFAVPDFAGCTSDGNSAVTTTSTFEGSASTHVTTFTGACGEIFMNSTALTRARNATDTYRVGLNVSRNAGTNSYIVDGAELMLKFGSPTSFALDSYDAQPYNGVILADFSGEFNFIEETDDLLTCIITIDQIQTPKTNDFASQRNPIGDIFVYDHETTSEKLSDYRYTATGDLSTTGEWSVSGVSTPYDPKYDTSYEMGYKCFLQERTFNGVSWSTGSQVLWQEGQSIDPDGDFYFTGSVLEIEPADTTPDFSVDCSDTDLICRLIGNLKTFFYEQTYIDPEIVAYKVASIKADLAGKQPFGYAFALLSTDLSGLVDGTVAYPTFAYRVGNLYDFTFTPPAFLITTLSTIKTVISVVLGLMFFTYAFYFVRRVTGS